MIKYAIVLDAAEDALKSADGWTTMSGCLLTAAKYYHKAEALIELLEVDHCGSIGGFGHWKGKDQEETRYSISLRGRLNWLKMVYKGRK